MVLPEGTPHREERRSTGRRALFIGAILLIAAGFVVLGGLAPSDQPSATEKTTTTSSTTTTTIAEILPPVDMENFSVDQLQTGPQFDWMQAAIEDANGYPIGIFSHDGALYLFATSAPDWRIASGGLVGWRSSDGTDWEPLGQVIAEDFRVSRVDSTPGGLVAAGTAPDGSAIVVWTSANGTEWSSEEIPVETPHPHIDRLITAIGVNQNALVVATNVELDGESLLEERLEAAGYDVELDFTGWGVEYQGDEGDAALTITGPLGIPALEVPLDDLALSEDERHWISNGYNVTPEVHTWTHPTGSADWIPGEIEGAHWVESIVARDDGTLLLSGWSGSGRLSMESENGLDWTELEADDQISRVQPWRDGMLAIAETSRPDLLFSDDGITWEEMGLADFFPLPIQWWANTHAVGDEGIALAVTGYRNSPVPDPEPTEIVTGDGYPMTLDLQQSVIEITTGDETYRWELHRPEPPGGISVDIVARTVTFSDPDTGEAITELTFEQLLNAEQDYYTNRFPADEYHAFVFTGDGSEWTIQASTSAFGDEVWIGDLEIVPGRVFAVTLRPGERYNAFATPEFDIWVAEIP